jgi:hypothetical protein
MPTSSRRRESTSQPKAVGRLKKTADEKRDAMTKVLVTADERDRFQAAADQMGVFPSTWVRLAAGAAISK